ncbi:WhiB family transcriptional regulator [Pilimelia columellifera]|uniref:Transcriptional regulator WhiB n=1 Tax=Pilimelia columellifera subsp. columellifera TaxID=706583 RepID=A0ABN3NEK2_9ACTN
MSDVRRLPTPVAEAWDWQRHSACRGRDSARFFHPEGERGAARRRREDRAKAICAACPVRRRCLEHALQVREPYGIWGGLGEGERNRILATGRLPLQRTA